jgi:hypothetical protein
LRGAYCLRLSYSGESINKKQLQVRETKDVPHTVFVWYKAREGSRVKRGELD